MKKTVLEISPPEFKERYKGDKFAQDVADAAIRFRDSYGPMPSIRCQQLILGLKKNTAPREMAKRFNLKPGLFRNEKYGSRDTAISVLDEKILPVYKESEKEFSRIIHKACRKLGADYSSVYADLIGTPFVNIEYDKRYKKFEINPTSRILHKHYQKMHAEDRTIHVLGIAFFEYQDAGGSNILTSTIQRGRFFRKSVKKDDHNEIGDYLKREHAKQKSGSEPFAPYGILEEVFLLAVGFCKAKDIFIPASSLVFERWKYVFKHWKKELGKDITETDFGIYDELGRRYGKKVRCLPKTRFTEKIGMPGFGWCIRLK